MLSKLIIAFACLTLCLSCCNKGTGFGFKLSGVKPGSNYYETGLRNDDVIKSINGKSVNNVKDAIKFLKSLKGVQKAQVVVLRQMTFDIETQDVDL